MPMKDPAEPAIKDRVRQVVDRSVADPDIAHLLELPRLLPSLPLAQEWSHAAAAAMELLAEYIGEPGGRAGADSEQDTGRVSGGEELTKLILLRWDHSGRAGVRRLLEGMDPYAAQGATVLLVSDLVIDRHRPGPELDAWAADAAKLASSCRPPRSLVAMSTALVWVRRVLFPLALLVGPALAVFWVLPAPVLTRAAVAAVMVVITFVAGNLIYGAFKGSRTNERPS